MVVGPVGCGTNRLYDQSVEPYRLVAVGDFFQLAPVSLGGGEAARYAFESDAWTALDFVNVELTEDFRQVHYSYWLTVLHTTLGYTLRYTC